MPFLASIQGSFGFGHPVPTSIVQTNLQVWLDAGNAASYTSGATTWSNLVSGNSAYNFSLVNSPTLSNTTYNGTTNTSISFNGTNQYASPKTSLLTLAQANSWAETREYWVYWRGTAGCLTMESGATTPDTSWFDAQAAMSNQFLAYSVWQGNIPMTAYIVYSSLTSNSWNHIIWQHNKATNTLMAYVNGVRTYSNASVSRTTPDSIAGIQFYTILMAPSSTNFGYGSGSYMSGTLGVYRWYNIILTSNQINQNYSAERARFGR